MTMPPQPKRLGLAIGSIAVVLLIGLIFWNGWTTNSSGQNVVSRTASVSPDRTATPVTLVEPTVATEPASPTNTVAPGPITSPVVVAKSNLQVRTGPGDIYELLGYLPSGTQANIAGRDESGQWWRIQTILGPAGYGWIRASDNQADITAADSVPIALGPPRPTFTLTASPQPPTPTRPPRATDTSELTATSTATLAPTTAPLSSLTPTPTSVAPVGEFTLLEPSSLEQPTYDVTEFEWRWSGALPEEYGFEVRVWQDGETPAGVHNAVLDNKSGVVQTLRNNTYRLVADITDTPGVRKQRGEYNWTVALVQIDPDYQDLGIQAPPGRLRYEPPFGRSSSGGEEENSSGGGKLN